MAEDSLTPEAPLAEDRQAKVEQIADLLTGKEPPAADADAEPKSQQAAQAPDPEAEPLADPEADAPELTPKAIAEQLGMTPTQLFRELKIPIEGGEPLTLEEVKKAGSRLREVSDVQESLEQQRVDFENEAMLQRQQMQELIGRLPPESLTTDFVAGVLQQHQTYVATETAALLEVRPDLKDAVKFKATRQLMVDFVKPYGFKAVEIDGIIDHRLAKFVIDMAEKDQRIRQLEKAGAHKPRADKRKSSTQPAKISRTRRTQQRADAAKGGTMQDKVAAVSALLQER